jgi:class 3 adenylate cyclase
MRISIQVKLFLILAGLTVIIVGGVLFILTNTLTEKIEQQVISDFQETQYAFRQQQNLVYDRLVESCYLIGENSTFKANVALNDPASIDFVVNDLARFAKVDLFIVTDVNGKVLAWLDQPEKQGINLASKLGVSEALVGIEPQVSIEWPGLWEVDGEILQVVTLPIYAANAIIGTISLGSRITQIEAENLKGNSNIDIHIFYGIYLVASTIEASGQADFEPFMNEKQTVINSSLESRQASPAFSMNLNDEPVFAFVSPLGVGEPAFYLATVPKSDELVILSVMQQNIFLTAGISFLITLLIAFILGKTLTRPILKLVSGMNKVSGGDLSVKVQTDSRDEIGLLTQAFNEMINGLRERLHLMKYVGSHTIDMVRKSSAGEAALGGTRQNLAVLFSDIRGFTAFSEQRPAEDVIQMLNRFLGFQAEIVTKYGGSVDKFVGDEMVALFMGEDCVDKALNCAIEIQNEIRRQNQSGKIGIEIGIGINYGSMIMGNMGAKERMDYTVIGAAVNLGARLCSAAQGGEILIPETSLSKASLDVQTVNRGKMTFKGIGQEIEIVEVRSA